MSFFHRSRGAHGPNSDWTEPDEDWDPATIAADLGEPVANVAAHHSANWKPVVGEPPWEPYGPAHPQPQPTTIVTFTEGITEEQQAAFRAYMDEPVEFTARVEPSQVLARARHLLADDPTFGWALRHAALDAIADLFNPEALDGE